MSASDRLSLSAAIVERLTPATVVELGCCGGALAEAIVRRVAGVSYTGVDRSALAIARASQRNRRLIAAGSAEFVCADFLHPPPAGYRHRTYEVCCAVNVNAFWTDPAGAFAAVGPLLAGGGRLLLVFEAPGADKAAAIARTLRDAAPEAFRVEQQIGPAAKMVAIIYRFATGTGRGSRR